MFIKNVPHVFVVAVVAHSGNTPVGLVVAERGRGNIIMKQEYAIEHNDGRGGGESMSYVKTMDDPFYVTRHSFCPPAY